MLFKQSLTTIVKIGVEEIVNYLASNLLPVVYVVSELVFGVICEQDPEVSILLQYTLP